MIFQKIRFPSQKEIEKEEREDIIWGLPDDCVPSNVCYEDGTPVVFEIDKCAPIKIGKHRWMGLEVIGGDVT